MSYQEKYLKYKSKYLQLKALKKNLQQLGGKKDNTDTEDTLMNADALSVTPTNTFVKPSVRKHSKKHSKSKRNLHTSVRSESSELFSSSTEASSITDSFDLSSSDGDL